MDKETLRMQMLAGVITEGEYKAIINKEIEEEKSSLNESMIGGIVGIGAINQIPSRTKTDYEMAFEHFLGERYQVKPNRERDDIKEDETSDMEEEVAEETGLYEEDVEENSLEDYFKKIKLKFPELGTKEFNDLASTYFGGNPNNSEEGKEVEEPTIYEDVVKGSNVKKVDGKYRVLSGKSGKMWPQTYDSKKDAEDAIKAYHANK